MLQYEIYRQRRNELIREAERRRLVRQARNAHREASGKAGGKGRGKPVNRPPGAESFGITA